VTVALFYLALGGLTATCFAALGAMSLHEFSRHDLEEICRRKKQFHRFGEILRHYERVGLSVESLQALTTTIFLASGALWAWLAREQSGLPEWTTLLGGILVGGLLLAVATVWVPWVFVHLWAEPFLFHTWRIWQAIALVMAPLVLAARGVDVVLHRLAGRNADEEDDEESIDEEIRSIVGEGHREGLLEEEEVDMIEAVIELDDADVADIMTPRSRMKMIDVETPWQDVVAQAIDIGSTRIPVFAENPDHVIGVLHVKDLLPVLARSPSDGKRPSLRALLRKPIFTTETKRVDDLLEEFQQTRTHIAIVMDEYHRVSGLATIEDVLEEIVGEIVDEHDDDEPPEIQRIDETTCEALGHVHLADVNEELGLELPEDAEYDSIGGLVMNRLGRIPQIGESVVWDDARITVLEVSRRHVERVRIELLDRAERV